MWCYRRFGHNEGDEPGFTQPLMYNKIRQHPGVSEIYGKRLIQEGVIDQAWMDEKVHQFTTLLEGEFEAGASYKPNKADWFAGRWTGLSAPTDGGTERRNVETGIEMKLFDALGRTLTTVPEGIQIHKTLGRVLDAKRQMFKTGENFDWATGEALAFGSLLSEGYGVRLSGQDSGRGTFSQRHAVWVDQTDEHKYVPLTTVEHGRSRCWTARFPIWRARVRIRLCAGGPQDARHVGGAVRRLRQRRADHDRPVHRER